MRKRAVEEGLRWLRQAEEDLHWTHLLAEKGAHHLACFLSQQVAGKALKGFLYAQGQEMVLGHSVERLCAAAAEYDPRFAEWARSWSLLDGYYIPTRYPNSLPDGIPSDVFTDQAARNAIELASQAVAAVREWFEGAGRSGEDD